MSSKLNWSKLILKVGKLKGNPMILWFCWSLSWCHRKLKKKKRERKRERNHPFWIPQFYNVYLNNKTFFPWIKRQTRGKQNRLFVQSCYYLCLNWIIGYSSDYFTNVLSLKLGIIWWSKVLRSLLPWQMATGIQLKG